MKARVVSDPVRAGQLQTSPFRSWEFDTAAFVLLDARNYRVKRAALLPVEVVEGLARRRPHVNGYVIMMSAALLDHPGSKDITTSLNQAAAQI